MSDYGHAVLVLENPSDEDWKAARIRGVGASETAAVLGMSPYESNVDVYIRKARLGGEWEGNEAADLGHLFEDTIAQEAARRLGLTILDTGVLLLQHPDHPWMLATPDRLAIDEHGRMGPLEVKMTAGPTVSADWDDDGIPHAAALQLAQQMAVIGSDVGWIGALVGGYGHRIEPRTVERNDDLIDVIVKRVGEFWSCVEAETPPAPLGNPKAARAALTDVFDALGETGAQEIDVDTIDLVNALAAAKARAKTASEEADAIAADVQHRLTVAEAEIGLVDGQEFVTWKQQSTTRLDQQAVKDAHPDWKTRFGKTTSSRVLRTPRKGTA